MTTLIIVITGNLTNLVVAVTGLVVALRGHQVVNTEVKPQVRANAQAVVKLSDELAPSALATEVKTIVNGGAASAH